MPKKKLLLIPAVVAMFAATAAGCDRDTAVAECLESTTRPAAVIPNNTPPRWPDPEDLLLPNNTPIDARGKLFSRNVGTKVEPQAGSRDNLCFVGGAVYNTDDANTTPWSTWHSRYGMIINTPNAKLIGGTYFNHGDAISFEKAAATNWTVVGVRAEGLPGWAGAYIHDDCVEDDSMNGGQILDSKFDGCANFLSASQNFAFGSPKTDGSGNEILVQDTLVRLQPMYNSFCPVTGPGCNTAYGYNQHGGFFKWAFDDAGDTTHWDGTAPDLKLTRVMLRADQPSAYGGSPNGKMAPPERTVCEDVVLINTETWIQDDVDDWVRVCGEENVSFGDSEDWDTAVAAWDAAHPAL